VNDHDIDHLEEVDPPARALAAEVAET